MRRVQALAFAAASLLAGCGKESTKGNELTKVGNDEHLAQATTATGCIQGVVLNGLTGERIELPASDSEAAKGLLVRVHERFLSANFTGTAALKGEYSLCGVPVEDEFPLYALVDGFQAYNTNISVTATVPQLSAQADTDLQKPAPTAIYNIRLYPTGQQTQDLRLHVVYAAQNVKGATVQLVPSNGNALDLDGFQPPTNGALLTLTAVTDDQGFATFPAAALALGGVYNYTVLPPAGAQYQMKKGGVTVGLLAEKPAHDAYLVDVVLENTAPKLAVVTQSREPNADGQKTCVFNRPVVLVPGTRAGVTATLSGSVEGELKDKVNVEISKDGLTLTLTPAWEKPVNSAKEPQAAVTYAGIYVKSAAAPDLAEQLDVASACDPTVGLAP